MYNVSKFDEIKQIITVLPLSNIPTDYISVGIHLKNELPTSQILGKKVSTIKCHPPPIMAVFILKTDYLDRLWQTFVVRVMHLKYKDGHKTYYASR